MAAQIVLRWAIGACALSAAVLSTADIPPPAYQLAAQQAGVPAPLLYAVALQESGTSLRGRLIPWPWTLNIAGTAQRYTTRNSACAALRRSLRRTLTTRIDAGLGQINIGYNAQRFGDPCEVLDPYRNLAITAAILRERYTSDWLVAAGRYHRPAGGAPAAHYRHRIDQHLSRVLGDPAQVATAEIRQL